MRLYLPKKIALAPLATLIALVAAHALTCNTLWGAPICVVVCYK
jgi:hypothetical protein